MAFHPSVEVKTFDTFGFPCKGVFVKPNHRITKGEHVWWWVENGASRSYTKEEVESAPSCPTPLSELANLGDCNEYIEVSPDLIAENPKESIIRFSYMWDDDCFETSPWPEEDISYFTNHSCAGNVGHRGDELYVAIRDIEENEQIFYDYALTETQDSYHRGLKCKCGSIKCRGVLDMLQYKDPVFIKMNYEDCMPHIQRKMRENGWLHDSVVRRTHFDADHYGLVALDPIPKSTVVVVLAGKIVAAKHVVNLSPRDQQMSHQIDTDLWQIPGADYETGSFINHSCEPNCGMKDAFRVVTTRDIAAGEPLTIDYAMINTGEPELPSRNFECLCGSEKCRRTITSKDYQVVGQHYLDFLSPFVREKYLAEVAE